LDFNCVILDRYSPWPALAGGSKSRALALARLRARLPGSLSESSLIAAANEVISCERSPTSAADTNSTRARIGVPRVRRQPCVRGTLEPHTRLWSQIPLRAKGNEMTTCHRNFEKGCQLERTPCSRRRGGPRPVKGQRVAIVEVNDALGNALPVNCLPLFSRRIRCGL
jgi:hypothetical protein